MAFSRPESGDKRHFMATINKLAAMLTDPETTSCKRTIFGSTGQKNNKTI
ncbi:hypothetical protein J2X69_002103 [Algoriphagus sp. 4150]|nr:hypothetical protein [Algoriphagus sp. 4150]